jgi:integrase
MKSFRARPRHPVTGARIVISARSAAELGAYVHRLDTLRTELRLGMTSAEQVDQALRHMRFGPVTLERVYRAYLERPDIAKNTRRAFTSWWATLAGELGAMPLASIDAPRVRRWVEGLARSGHAASTIDAAWRKLSALGTYAAARGWIAGAPWGKARPPKVGGPGRGPPDAAANVGELVAILRSARALDRESPYRGLAAKFFLAMLFGLRQGELAGLRWSDIDLGPPLVIQVVRQWQRDPLKRGTRPARLEGLPEAGSVLKIHQLELMSRGLYAARGPVFPATDSARDAPRAYSKGEVLRRGDVRAVIQGAAIRTPGAIERWSAHALRGSFVTLEALASGGDMRRVQARSRHASLASLVRYLRQMTQSAPTSPLMSELPGLYGGDAGASRSNPTQRRALPAATLARGGA